VRTRGEGLLKELEALGDLRGRVDVERRAVFFRESGERDLIAVECAVAVCEGTCGGGLGDYGSLLLQSDGVLSLVEL
jgi:hypothetical protein